MQDIDRIRRAEAKLDFVAEMSGLCVWEADLQAGTLTYDDAYVSLLGYDPGTLVHGFDEWGAIVHPDDAAAAGQVMTDYLEGKTDLYSAEMRLRCADGHYVWTVETGRAMAWDEMGRPARMQGSHLNIDKLKRAELRLHEALALIEQHNEQLQGEVQRAVHDLAETQQFSGAMFDANPYINVIYDDTLRLTDCNPAAIEYFGFESKDDLLRNLGRLLEESTPGFQPDGSPSIPLSARFEYVLEHGFIEFETELVLPRGRTPIRTTLKKIAHGDSFAIAAYMVDMHQLKEARGELMRQDYLLRQVNKAATRLMEADPARFDTVVNRTLHSLGVAVGADRMHIWENYEQDGQLYCRRLYHWDGSEGENAQDEVLSTDVPYAAMGEAWQKRLTAKKSIGSLRADLPEYVRHNLVPRGTQAVLIIPVSLRGGFWGLIVLENAREGRLFTATEEKVIESGGILVVSAILRNQVNAGLIEAREAALASDKAKSDFLSRMSHEIRTPMNAIIGMTQVAKKLDDVERLHYSLGKIDTASQQLLDIINDILDMSKIESGKFEIVPVEFDFEKMLQNTMNMIQVRLDEKGQHFNSLRLRGFERLLVADELRLSQVLINLLTNAVKFTPEGGDIGLLVDYTEREDEAGKIGCTLHVEVSDNGIGLSPEQQQKLFRSFEQADGGISRRFGGTGLGLAICKSIVTMMGGDIWVTSALGAGSTFTFEVPFSWGHPLSEAVAAPAPPPASGGHWPGKRLLLVEDVEINREIVLSILEDSGLEISCAENGLRAVEAMREAPDAWDLVLMDVQMPEMDGIEATRQIRALGLGRTASVPILAMTANAFNEDVQNCLAAGMNGHIAKPIDVDVLMRTLAKYLDD